MKLCDWHISLSPNYYSHSILHFHSEIPSGCTSFHVQLSINFLQWFISSSCCGTLHFHTAEILYYEGAVGILLHLYVNSHRYQRDTRYHPIYSIIHWAGALRGTCRQEKAHTKAQHGAISPLHGSYLLSSGDHWLLKKTLEWSNLVLDNSFIPMRIIIFPHIESSKYPSWSSIVLMPPIKSVPQGKSDLRSCLYWFLLPFATQKILTVSNILRLNLLPTPIHPTVRQNNPPLRKNCQPPHIRGCQLCQHFV